MSFDNVLIDITSLKFLITKNNNLLIYIKYHNLITSVKMHENMWHKIIINKTKNKIEKIDIKLIV